MAKNRRKEKRYIEFRGLRWLVPNSEWGDYLRRGLIERISGRVARLRAGVEITVENGRHLLRDLGRAIEISIPSSWRMIERAALFDTRGPRLTPAQIQREIQAGYCRMRTEGWEAV